MLLTPLQIDSRQHIVSGFTTNFFFITTKYISVIIIAQNTNIIEISHSTSFIDFVQLTCSKRYNIYLLSDVYRNYFTPVYT
jgi:hypothetical protein